MNTKKFRTLVGKGANRYIIGRISGMMMAICGSSDIKEYPNLADKYGTILTVKCTMKQYTEFMNLVEEKYPDMCIFCYE